MNILKLTQTKSIIILIISVISIILAITIKKFYFIGICIFIVTLLYASGCMLYTVLKNK